MANLAIKGHPTRGKEVIQLLEMLGGVNKHQIDAIRQTYVYFIDIDGIIRLLQISQLHTELYIVYSLEEFEEKYPYKVGDKVTLDNKLCSIIWMCWECNNIYYQVQGIGDVFTKKVAAEDLQPYKEKTMEETGVLEQIDLTRELRIADEVEVILGDYEFVLKDGKTYFVKKKPQYPKNYEECCKILGIDTQFCMKYLPHGTFSYKDEIIYNLQELLICRDAYWKTAGKQMGLGKPWEPDWNDLNRKYFISLTCGGINLYDDFRNPQVLVFPTAEMRDAFYENFKDLIEFCKELL